MDHETVAAYLNRVGVTARRIPSTASTQATPIDVSSGPRHAAAATKMAVSSETSLPPRPT